MPGGRPKGTKRTGGRPKGTPNKRSEDTRRLIEETIGASPLERMARLAQELLDGKHKLCKPMVVDKQLELVEDRGYQLRLAADLFSEVAQYHSPKRKAIEHSMSTDTAMTLADLIGRARSRGS